jgi:hypothetical protein
MNDYVCMIMIMYDYHTTLDTYKLWNRTSYELQVDDDLRFPLIVRYRNHVMNMLNHSSYSTHNILKFGDC